MAHEALRDRARLTALNAASWSLLSMVITKAAIANAVVSSLLLAITARACPTPAALSASPNPACVIEYLMAVSEAGARLGGGVVRVELERASSRSPAKLSRRPAGIGVADVGNGAQKEVVGVKVLGPLPTRSFDLRSQQARFDDANHLLCDLILQIENVFQRAVESVRPQMRPGLGFDELTGDAQSAVRLADTPPRHSARRARARPA